MDIEPVWIVNVLVATTSARFLVTSFAVAAVLLKILKQR